MMMVFDKPTVACQLVCGLLEAMRISATENIKQPNLSSFLEEVESGATAHISKLVFRPDMKQVRVCHSTSHALHSLLLVL